MTETKLLERGVELALAWLVDHPGRDACDAATAVIMNSNIAPGHFVGQFDDLGRERWPDFLRAVEEAIGD